MLNIPDSVKALFKTDGVHKNFRSPNNGGISNENILQESVRFTESACSRDVFRFGCAERSVLEFETVGVGNLRGREMQFWMDIDISNLSAAERTEIAANINSYDGTITLTTTALGWPFYSVPLGTFVVDSCPRNHGAMTRRKFTCYSKALAMPAVEAAKLSYAGDFGPDGYTPTAKNLVYSGLAPLAVREAYTETSWKTWSNMGSAQIANTVSLGGGLSLEVLGTYRFQAFTDSASTTDDALFSVSIPANPAGYWLTWLQQQLTDQGVTMTDAGLTRLLAWLDPFLSFAGWAPVNNPFGYGILRLSEPYYPVVYPYTSPGNLARLWLPESVTLTLLRGTTTVAQWTFSPFGSAASYPYVSRWTEISADTPIPLSIQPAVESMNGGQRVSYNDVYDFPALVQGYLELNAMMARPMRRTGGYGPLWEFFRLNAAAAAPVGPADYASGEVWWDEYDVEPIGTVVYRYGEDLVQTYTFGDGESVYDMQDNEVLRLLAGATPAGINALLDALFVPYVTGIGFTPVEMTMQGWLYLQAGDALEITAEDGTVVNTYAMRCEFNGIQHLTAGIESSGGEIIEED